MKKKILTSVFLIFVISIGMLSAQQVLETSYAFDEFNTSGRLITVTGSRKLTLTKNESEGYIEVKFDTLKGGATDDFINFQFARALDLTKLEDRIVTFEHESDKSMICWFAFGNVSWGPYSQAVQNKSILLFDFGREEVKVTFQQDDELKGTFDPTKVSNAYLILNPTFVAPTFTTGELILPGIMKLYNIKIGNSTTLSADQIEVVNKTYVYFDDEQKVINYKNLNVGTEISVYDNMGKLVSSQIANHDAGRINGSSLNSGLYHVYTLIGNKRESFKIIVQ